MLPIVNIWKLLSNFHKSMGFGSFNIYFFEPIYKITMCQIIFFNMI
ncbi:hypothetical protein YM116_2729 [Enterococcus faecalis]|nr:hypothetical protein YM116_2729 [Enterococcus faecalis]